MKKSIEDLSPEEFQKYLLDFFKKIVLDNFHNVKPETKLKVGKFYRLENGMKAIFSYEGEFNFSGVVVGLIGDFIWRKDGKQHDSRPGYDVVGEWED